MLRLRGKSRNALNAKCTRNPNLWLPYTHGNGQADHGLDYTLILLGHLKIKCFWLLLILIPNGWMSFTIICELRNLGEGKGCLLEVTVKKMVI